jgi:hypothetical protein
MPLWYESLSDTKIRDYFGIYVKLKDMNEKRTVFNAVRCFVYSEIPFL